MLSVGLQLISSRGRFEEGNRYTFTETFFVGANDSAVDYLERSRLNLQRLMSKVVGVGDRPIGSTRSIWFKRLRSINSCSADADERSSMELKQSLTWNQNKPKSNWRLLQFHNFCLLKSFSFISWSFEHSCTKFDLLLVNANFNLCFVMRQV